MSKESAHIELAAQEQGRLHAIGNFVTDHLRHGAAIGASAIALFGAHNEISSSEAVADSRQAESAEAYASANKPMKPAAIMRGIYTGYYQAYGSTGTIKMRVATLAPQKLTIQGRCVTGQTHPEIKSVDERKASLTQYYCNGLKLHKPRRDLVANQVVDYQPVLNKLGKRAARSAGVANSKIPATTSYITSTRNQATLFYKANPGASNKQLRALKLDARGKTTKVTKQWYK